MHTVYQSFYVSLSHVGQWLTPVSHLLSLEHPPNSSSDYFSMFPLNLVILRSDLCHEVTSKFTNLVLQQIQPVSYQQKSNQNTGVQK